MTMNYEIEFHPVGDATKAGDAISVRCGLNGNYEVLVVDGGTSDSGKNLVEHIKRFYGENTVIAHAISSHPDSDHASGLREVLRTFEVKNLWVHGLWTHAAELLPYYEDKRLTADGLAKKLREAYPVVEELIELANAQGTSIREPFQGAVIGPFVVMSPTRYAYTRLVPQFRKGPAPDIDALKAERFWLGERPQPNILAQLIEKAASWIDETWDIELLREGAVTAAENETSTVLYGSLGSHSVLLTADAGVNALVWTCDYANQLGIDLSALTLVQVPHHGSRSNVTPSVLDRLLGPKQGIAAPAKRSAIVSCPKDDEKHPRKMVVNAFRRRGAPVHKTQGAYFRHFDGIPMRANEVAAVPFDWFTRVEDYD